MTFVVDLAIIAIWIVFLATGQDPELQTEPIAIGLHLTLEFLTAALLLFSLYQVFVESVKRFA